MRPLVQVGTQAPDFELDGTDGTPEGRRTFTLSEFRGSPVVLIFYPEDNTVVCTEQLTSYTADLSIFGQVGAKVLALSPQSVESHEGFAGLHGPFGFPLLADTDLEVGEAYGILGPLGFYRRSAVVIDPDGIVVFAYRSITGLSFRSATELAEVVRGFRDAAAADEPGR
ncbi:MAG: peroxiredoxin [Actinomycetota bacterium]|nr:peroxiredoxin [Actinomycetota bacterium]